MHAHLHEPPVGRKLLLGIAISTLLLTGEVVGGLLANSLALLSDAGHVATDIFALLFSWLGVRQAARPATHRMTFGYHRVGIFIALVNALTLVGISAFIFYEAYRRLQAPPEVEGDLMLMVAVAGFVGNLVVAALLRHEQAENINVKSAFLHVMSDLLSSAATILGGGLIALTSQSWIDPVLGALIGIFILVSSRPIIWESLSILLEATPQHIDLAELVRAMRLVPGVEDVHDLHVWTIAPGIHMLSSHVVVQDMPVSQAARLLDQLNEMLAKQFSIGHTTIQIETVRCSPSGLYCTLVPVGVEVEEPETHRR